MAFDLARGCDREEDYEVVRHIGSGSYGEVFLVTHKAENRAYVMKDITSFASMDDKQRESTELEVRLLSLMQHPNIVAYRACLINQDGHLCIVMEFCEHGDVHTYMQTAKRTGRPPPGEPLVLEWFVQISLALQALHARKILHRDLKTQNIFMKGCGSQQGFAMKLGDLGIARVLNTTAELAMTQIGTPFYMSPELFNNKPYGYKSDVWALGCILYELINGQHAFEAQSINGLALKILKARYTPITSSCSGETKNLIKSMLCTNPAHRPTLQELLHLPGVRRHVAGAVRSAVASAAAAGLPEAKARAEGTLAEQLGVLGLHGLGGLAERPGGGGGEPARRERHQLQQRLERAERRKKREEETLRRLQETESVLSQYLDEAPQCNRPARVGDRPAPALAAKSCDPSPHGVGNRVGFSGYVGSPAARPHPRPSHQAPPLPISPVPLGGASVTARSDLHNGEAAADEDAPAMSHRDRVLWRKERRREEEQQRFEEEARKIREENLAYQRAWVQGSKEGAMSPPRPQRTPGKEWSPTIGNSVGRAHAGASQLPGHLAPLLDYNHITPANLAHPFQSCRQKVVHTPKPNTSWASEWGSGGSQEEAQGPRWSVAAGPRPPPVQYGEPSPPHQAQQGKSRWRRMGRGDETHVATSRSLRSVYLEALIEQQLDHSEDSEFSPSHSEGSDGAPVGGPGRLTSDDEQLRQQSWDVQDRIEQCRAAINRHKMTIETVQHTFANDPEVTLTAPVGEEPPITWRATATHRQTVPAIIQDRVARLRRRCLEGLGGQKFQAARQCLQSLLGSDDTAVGAALARQQMLDMLGFDKIGFYSLIDQIVHMESQWGSTLGYPCGDFSADDLPQGNLRQCASTTREPHHRAVPGRQTE